MGEATLKKLVCLLEALYPIFLSFGSSLLMSRSKIVVVPDICEPKRTARQGLELSIGLPRLGYVGFKIVNPLIRHVQALLECGVLGLQAGDVIVEVDFISAFPAATVAVGALRQCEVGLAVPAFQTSASRRHSGVVLVLIEPTLSFRIAFQAATVVWVRGVVGVAKPVGV
ncbi:hypothetical protein [Pseudomonas sp. LS-2]|uniref:hypothetical protein n=1 Tax=Pseudomonas sp. LS-2 TaxID=2315859 RepID=UPI0014045FF1|nr:hypothetical protein [Pseudomonas sp. LS-2]